MSELQVEKEMPSKGKESSLSINIFSRHEYLAKVPDGLQISPYRLVKSSKEAR